MNMIGMLLIMISLYFIGFTFMIIFREKMNPTFWNPIFITLTFFSQMFYCLMTNINRNSFGGFQVLENISPLCFMTMPLTFIMKEKPKNAYFSMISFLNIGMFVAMLIDPEYAYLFSFRQEASLLYLFAALEHLLCSLFGVYLILSEQVKPTFKNLGLGALILYSVISVAVICNFIFKTSFFGMNPYGNYHIYMMDFFGSFYATLIAYYIGIAAVLFAGFGFALLLDRIFHLSENKKNS